MALNSDFIAAIERLVAEQGRDALLDARRRGALLADYTKGEYQKERRRLQQAFDDGYAQTIADAGDLAAATASIIKRMQDEDGLTQEAAREMADLLALALRGERAGEHERLVENEEDFTIDIDRNDADTYPETLNTYMERGIGYFETGDYDRAIADYNQAIIICSNMAATNASRDITCEKKGEYDQIIAMIMPAACRASASFSLSYDQIITMCMPAAYVKRGTAYRFKGDYDRAIADYTQAIIIYSNMDAANASRDITCEKKGEYDQIIAKCMFAAYANRGLAYDEKGDYDYDRAIADYTQAIKIDPSVAITYKIRSLAYKAKGDYDRANADYTQAIKIDTDNAGYRESLANAKKRGGGKYGKI